MKSDGEARLGMVGRVLWSVIVGMAAIWGALALWYQAPGAETVHSLIVALWCLLSIAMLAALWRGRAVLGIVGFAAAFITLIIWWQLLRPSNDRIWADDVARMMTGTVDGNHVTLHNVRNFDWRSDSDYAQRWETRRFDLDRLESVDMIMSYWSGPAIAHMLVSFGFGDADQVVFSVEIRPEKGEAFSEIGGFFDEFELSIVAADERDVIRVRTNVRGEDDYLYRINMPKSAMRSLLVAYIDEAEANRRLSSLGLSTAADGIPAGICLRHRWPHAALFVRRTAIPRTHHRTRQARRSKRELLPRYPAGRTGNSGSAMT
jgi:hypothetical protein